MSKFKQAILIALVACFTAGSAYLAKSNLSSAYYIIVFGCPKRFFVDRGLTFDRGVCNRSYLGFDFISDALSGILFASIALFSFAFLIHFLMSPILRRISDQLVERKKQKKRRYRY